MWNWWQSLWVQDPGDAVWKSGRVLCELVLLMDPCVFLTWLFPLPFFIFLLVLFNMPGPDSLPGSSYNQIYSNWEPQVWHGKKIGTISRWGLLIQVPKWKARGSAMVGLALNLSMQFITMLLGSLLLMALEHINVYCMRKLDGCRWQWKANSAAFCLLTKHFLADYLIVYLILEINMYILRLEKWLLNILLPKVEQCAKCIKSKWLFPFVQFITLLNGLKLCKRLFSLFVMWFALYFVAYDLSIIFTCIVLYFYMLYMNFIQGDLERESLLSIALPCLNIGLNDW